MLLDITLQNLQKQGLLSDQRQTHFVVAYSGGVDSTVLLHLMAQLRSKYNVLLTAAYYNHGWREEPEELAIIHQHCSKLKVPLVLISTDRTRPKTETEGRKTRYKALTSLASDLQAQAVLTAHHADDQVETILFNLFRGTGLDGLTGIQSKLVLDAPFGAPIPVVRPMLDIFKDGILRYAQANHLEFFEDPSNQNTKHHRNALRKEIIPAIHQRFGNAKTAMLRLSALVEGDIDILEDATEPVWERLHVPSTQKHELETFDLQAFNQLSKAYQRRFVKQFLEKHHMGVDYQTIENLIQFLEGEGRADHAVGFKSLEGGHKTDRPFLSIYKNRVSLVTLPQDFNDPGKPMPAEKTAGEETVLQIPCTVRNDQNPLFDFKVRINALPPAKSDRIVVLRPAKTREMIVDVGAFWNKPLELRTRRPGDRFQPFGMAQPMHLKKYFINKGISRFDRDNIPLLACGREILWVIGHGVSEKLRIIESPSEYFVRRLAQIRLLALDEPEELIIVDEDEKRGDDKEEGEELMSEAESTEADESVASADGDVETLDEEKAMSSSAVAMLPERPGSSDSDYLEESSQEALSLEELNLEPEET